MLRYLAGCPILSYLTPMCSFLCQSQQFEPTHLHLPRQGMVPHLSHELLGGQDKFMVEQPAWLFLKERGVGMNEDRLLLFHCAIATTSQACCVVKVTGSDGLRSRQKRKSKGKPDSQAPMALAMFRAQVSGELER